MIVNNYFHITASKIFASQFLFSDHLKHKTVNETNCRTLTGNPRQLCILVGELSY